MDLYRAQAATWLTRRNVSIVSPSEVIIVRCRLFFTCVAILRPVYGNLSQKTDQSFQQGSIGTALRRISKTL